MENIFWLVLFVWLISFFAVLLMCFFLIIARSLLTFFSKGNTAKRFSKIKLVLKTINVWLFIIDITIMSYGMIILGLLSVFNAVSQGITDFRGMILFFTGCPIAVVCTDILLKEIYLGLNPSKPRYF